MPPPTSSPLRAVIFDVDGTLVDSVDLHAQAWVEAFAEFGKTCGFAEVRQQIGKGGDQLMPVFLSPEELERFGEKLLAARKKLFADKYLADVHGFPRARELFQRVLAGGQKIALASSAAGDELAAYKKAANITDLVDEETSSDDAEKSKPFPDIFQAALKRLSLTPEEAIVVGDTPYDAQAATKAGLRTVGMLCGGFPEDDLRDAGCVAIYLDPGDLLDRYDGSPLGRR